VAVGGTAVADGAIVAVAGTFIVAVATAVLGFVGPEAFSSSFPQAPASKATRHVTMIAASVHLVLIGTPPERG
jgi:hypothetical protein